MESNDEKYQVLLQICTYKIFLSFSQDELIKEMSDAIFFFVIKKVALSWDVTDVTTYIGMSSKQFQIFHRVVFDLQAIVVQNTRYFS